MTSAPETLRKQSLKCEQKLWANLINTRCQCREETILQPFVFQAFFETARRARPGRGVGTIRSGFQVRRAVTWAANLCNVKLFVDTLKLSKYFLNQFKGNTVAVAESRCMRSEERVTNSNVARFCKFVHFYCIFVKLITIKIHLHFGYVLQLSIKKMGLITSLSLAVKT